MNRDQLVRCAWPISDSRSGKIHTDKMVRYHDTEWGVPIHDDSRLFEHLTLGGAQAGLSWSTVFNKREAYRVAFEGFEIGAVARFSDRRVEQLLQDPGIIRNRQKILSAIHNAKAAARIQDECGSFGSYLWDFVDGVPVKNAHKTLSDLPATDGVSDLLSADLIYHGFSFVGSTICYAFMQAVGMVNDHTVACFRYNAV